MQTEILYRIMNQGGLHDVNSESTDLNGAPNMIIGKGGALTMDNRKQNPFNFQSNKLKTLGIGTMGQFPPPRVQGAFPAPLLGGRVGSFQSPLNILSDLAAGDGKRGATDDLRWPHSSTKRLKVEGNPTSTKNNPVLLERLSSMRGGFPMPKWDGVKTQSVKPAETSQEGVSGKSRAEFILPPLNEKQSERKPPTFESFRELWHKTDEDLRGEVLARRLEHGRAKPSVVSKPRL